MTVGRGETGETETDTEIEREREKSKEQIESNLQAKRNYNSSSPGVA